MITFAPIGYMGRLGNQMFQFASTLGVAEKTRQEAFFPLENCTTYSNTGPIDISTGKNMQVKCDLLDCFLIDKKYFIPSNLIEVQQVFQENDFAYDPSVLSIREKTSLAGYFQTEKYFLHCRDLILSQFIFKQKFQETAFSSLQEIKQKYPKSNIISIHVRRGDYVLFPDHHPTCSESYYTESIKYFQNILDNPQFVVFSDDIDWCKNEFIGDQFTISSLPDSYSDLCFMTMCDHHIIANSSFSWWGAWLNRNENKKVIAPSQWFGRLINKNTKDIYPQNWIVK